MVDFRTNYLNYYCGYLDGFGGEKGSVDESLEMMKKRQEMELSL